MPDSELRRLLASGLDPRTAKIEAPQLAALEAGYRAWPGAATRAAVDEDKRGLTLFDSLIRFLLHALREEQRHGDELRHIQAEYAQRHLAAESQAERERHVIDFARALGADRETLRGDRAAFARWFGYDAVLDRYHRRVARHCRRLTFTLNRLGMLTRQLCRETPPAEIFDLWQRLAIEDGVRPLLAFDGDPRVRVAAFQALATALQGVPTPVQERAVDQATLQYIYRSALEQAQDTWIQCEAISLLQTLSITSLVTVLQKRLSQPGGGDDLFVRRRAVLVLAENLARAPALHELLPAIARDPSPFVRQALAVALVSAGAEVATAWLPVLVHDDPAREVRAAALLQVPLLVETPAFHATALALMRRVFAEEQDAFVLRVALEAVVGSFARLRRGADPERTAAWQEGLVPAIQQLHQQARALPNRRQAAEILERLWCLQHAEASALHDELAPFVRRIAPGRSRFLPRRFLRGARRALLPRVLSVLAQRDFPFELSFGWFGARLRRGHHFATRSWRIWHEVTHPSPDKRQAFRHTIGRVFGGRIHIPSGILAELAETKVPGEPLYIGDEGGWRPYLPLVDELISCLDLPPLAPPLRIYTAEGLVEVVPPASPLTRIAARLRLTFRFATFARLRNWQDGGQAAATTYVAAIERLGFRVRLAPHPEAGTADPAVARFFPAGFAFTPADWWPRFENYFYSAFDNTLDHLVVFIAGGILLFVGRHLGLNFLQRRYRRQIPLSVGGWGTRGKSGTERLKAALFNALGYSVMSKTTGCEAMFLHCDTYGSLREMFLFRPYDKATIWEQHHVTRLGAKLGADVFLWECMALNPSFVELLQQRWMRDDIATLTNTFPDHEDIQGPAGINIPEVMTRFIPGSRVVLTSEEVMLPILAHGAATRGSTLKSVGWLEAGLITPDLLDRFPYQEHPFNIALVMAMAEELGIATDYAVKAMADFVVADLGVLKVFPPAPMRTRELEFSNGMSANERFGCLSNWRRLGFDKQTPDVDPGVMLTTVVNNRADRVARSRVFAGVLVADVAADRHVLIGSNLRGLQGYIRESWDSHVADVSLWPAADDAPSPAEIFEQQARRLRIACTPAAVQARLTVMIRAVAPTADHAAIAAAWQDPAAVAAALQAAGADTLAAEVIAHLERDLTAWREYAAFALKVATPPAADPALNDEFRALLWRWFERKIVVVEDYHASGDQIINLLCTETPPGFRNRVMGVQNIKGTGLDFVYRWLAWDKCHRACQQLMSPDATQVRTGAQTLTTFQEFGLLCEETTRRAVDTTRQSVHAQHERIQAELGQILANLERGLSDVRARMQIVRSTGRRERFIQFVEDILDAGEAITRRKTANRIYEDLIAERISHERAALELQSLTKKQKGGWLAEKLQHGGA